MGMPPTKIPKTRRATALVALLSALLAAPPTLTSAALAPEPVAPVVARLVAGLLEKAHYNQRPIDDAASKQMLRNFIEYFDYNHMVLNAADVSEFENRFGASLDDRLKAGDVSPAYVVFDRLTKRLEERVTLANKLLDAGFTFTADESVSLDRRNAAWPSTEEEATGLWRLRLKSEVLQERLGGAKEPDQVKTVRTRYDRLLRTFREYDSSTVLQSYLTALGHTFDPHTDYMAPAQVENFNISMRLSLVGIGAVLRSEDGYAKIVSLVPGGPADVDKRLKPNDRIAEVAQGDEPFQELMGMNLDKVVALIRGKKGTKVRLKVIPHDALDESTRVVVSLVRDEIKLTEQEAKAKVLIKSDAEGKKVKIGYIDLPSFYADMGGSTAKSTTRDVERLINRLKRDNVDGLILDLRRNSGGSLQEAVALTGLFIPQGPVVQVKDTEGGSKTLRDEDPSMAYSGPLVVLASRGSASASEILAGAVQDYRRGLVVGEKSTFGKGTVQAMIDLATQLPEPLRTLKPGSLKLTIQKFYRVSGASTQSRGVIPDIRLPSVADEGDFSESSQKNALPYDEVEPVRYQPTDAVGGAVTQLAAASAERVTASREFAWVKEDIERYKKQQADKSVSLNEEKRRAEKKANETRNKERAKERLASKEPGYEEGAEITLAILDGKPPLPKPKVEPEKPKHLDPDADDGEDYDKGGPAPDLFLREGVNILADLIAGNRQRQGYPVAYPGAQ